MTPEQRSIKARLAAQTRWANTTDRADATKSARRAWHDRWEKKADPDGVLSPTERADKADRLMKAHMTAMALRSSLARSRRIARTASNQQDSKRADGQQKRPTAGPTDDQVLDR